MHEHTDAFAEDVPAVDDLAAGDRVARRASLRLDSVFVVVADAHAAGAQVVERRVDQRAPRRALAQQQAVAAHVAHRHVSQLHLHSPTHHYRRVAQERRGLVVRRGGRGRQLPVGVRQRDALEPHAARARLLASDHLEERREARRRDEALDGDGAFRLGEVGGGGRVRELDRAVAAGLGGELARRVERPRAAALEDESAARVLQMVAERLAARPVEDERARRRVVSDDRVAGGCP